MKGKCTDTQTYRMNVPFPRQVTDKATQTRRSNHTMIHHIDTYCLHKSRDSCNPTLLSIHYKRLHLANPSFPCTFRSTEDVVIISSSWLPQPRAFIFIFPISWSQYIWVPIKHPRANSIAVYHFCAYNRPAECSAIIFVLLNISGIAVMRAVLFVIIERHVYC